MRMFFFHRFNSSASTVTRQSLTAHGQVPSRRNHAGDASSAPAPVPNHQSGLLCISEGHYRRISLFVSPAIIILLAFLGFGKAICSFLAMPFHAMWDGGLAQAYRIYHGSGTFWALLVGSFMATAFLTPLAMGFARRIGAVEKGGQRKVSQKAMPLLGGLAVAIPFLIVCGLGIIGPTDLLGLLHGQHSPLWATLIGSLFILGMGVIDDTRGMRVRHKFLAQVAAALFLCLCGYSVHSINLPMLGSINLGLIPGTIFTVLWIVGLTNALNIIDGLDGLASGIALIATVALGFIAAFNGSLIVVLLCATLAGSLAAFLLFNFHPARIFLGDAGSLFLGFALASISLTCSMKTMGTVVFLAPMLALGLPIFEVGFSMLRRLVRGLPILSADASHIHHRLLNRGFSQRRVVLIMYGAGIICMLAALFTATMSSEKASALLLPLGMYIIVIMVMGWLARYSRDLHDILEVRKRNAYYQAFINYARMALNNEAGAMDVHSVLRTIQREMLLSYLDVSFEDPAQPIGACGTPLTDENSISLQPVREAYLKAPDGKRILIRYQQDGTTSEREMEEVRRHLGRLFEHATIKRMELSDKTELIEIYNSSHSQKECPSVIQQPEWQPVQTMLQKSAADAVIHHTDDRGRIAS